jgi:hypothetical protein
MVPTPFSAHHSANSKSCSSLIWHPKGKKKIITQIQLFPTQQAAQKEHAYQRDNIDDDD